MTSFARGIVLVALAATGVAVTLRAQPTSSRGVAWAAAPVNLDARVGLVKAVDAAPEAATESEVRALRASMPDVRVGFDPTTGATRTLWNPAGYLTVGDGRDPELVAADFVASRTALLGLSPSDVVDAELTDHVFSSASGVTHVYYRQRVSGVPVYNALLQVNVTRDGRILSVANGFVPDLTASVASLAPRMGALAAVARAADQFGLGDVPARLLGRAADRQQTTLLQAPDLSGQDIRAQLMVLPLSKGQARLVWNFQIWTPDGAHAFDYTVDAESGQVWTRFDWVAGDRYRVYPLPAESPAHVTPAPPFDGRVFVINPADAVASPFGWHDIDGITGAEFVATEGNNVHAYADADNDNRPDFGGTPACLAPLDCDFPLDLTSPPPAYQSAAVTNLFYWANIVHDVQYRYGFDEAAGNFQLFNYGRGGVAGDALLAEAQDSVGLAPAGGSRNNANFATPPDGMRPRMQMYAWTGSTPERDGDLDAGIVVHEYGHGISNRLVGGPSQVSCLANPQQPGEGISDWLALVFTARGTDTAAQGRGVATYAMGQPPGGLGIRGQRYSTDPAVNTWTYESITGASIPHGVGAVWGQAMWEVYWALVSHHGFDHNLYNATGSAGNQRALLYHTEGLKNTPCNPSFVDVRDAIIQAAQVLHAGEDVCRIWQAFAGFGLGVDAQSGGAFSTTPINGFNVPVACGGAPPPLVSIDDTSVVEGSSPHAAFTVSMNVPSASPVTVSYATAAGSATSGATPSSVTNTLAIGIPDAGPASFYPSTIAVPAGAGSVQAVAVTLHGFSHSYPDDVDVLLVGPTGQRTLLMSDVGGSFVVAGLSLTFRDDAPGPVPGAALTSGTYRPTNAGGGDAFPGPAPPAPYASGLDTFVGSPASGTWRLFIVDDGAGDSGAISGGWTLHLGLAGNDFVARHGTITFPPGATTQTVSVPLLDDAVVEADEAFGVVLSRPGGGEILDGHAVGVIVDDDVPQSAEPPAGLRVTAIVGRTVTLAWIPPATGSPPTGYLIEGGANPGEVAAAIPTASTMPAYTFTAPTGAYYVRVHTLVGSLKSAASNEIPLRVGVPVAPSPPANLLGVAEGASVTLVWTNTFTGGAPTGLVLEVTGAATTSVAMGVVDRFTAGGVEPGVYTLRLRATNAAGTSAPSNPVTLTVPGTCAGAPGTPVGVVAYRLGQTVFVAWEPPESGPAPTGYVLQVAGALVGQFPTATRALSGVVGRGSYELRVTAANACGASAPSPVFLVTVP